MGLFGPVPGNGHCLFTGACAGTDYAQLPVNTHWPRYGSEDTGSGHGSPEEDAGEPTLWYGMSCLVLPFIALGT